MAKFVFNYAKGKVGYYGTLPAASDALIAVAIKTSGIEPDSTMIEHTALDDLLALSNEQTTVGRKTLGSVTSTVDATNDKLVVDAADFTYSTASGDPIGAIVVCYVPNTGTSTDADIIPLLKYDFSAVPAGTDIPVQISTNGLYAASGTA